MRTVVVTDAVREVDGRVDGDRLLIPSDALAGATGWELKPQGLCRGDVCVPVGDTDGLLVDGMIDLASLGAALHWPTVVDAPEGVAAMTEPAADRAAVLAALEAPDFTLPDLDGNPVTFSTFTGKKKLLVAWASW